MPYTEYSNISVNTDFLSDIYLRPSCYSCAAKSGRSGSDITLGDFWGVENIFPDFDDDKGISICLLNTELGKKEIESLEKVLKIEVDYNQVLRGNPSLEQNAKLNDKLRMCYWAKTDRIGAISCVLKKMKPGLVEKCIDRIKRVIRK